MDVKPAGKKTLKDSLYKTVFVLAWPAIIEMLLHVTVGLVDTAMVGRLGAETLAAVGLSNQLMALFTVILSAIGTGNTALVARFIGAKNPIEAGQAAEQAVYLAVGIAVIVESLLLVFCEPILGFLFRTTELEVLSLSSQYVKIVALALMFNYCLVLINSTLRGVGDTKTPMHITAIVNLINIIGNLILIFGFGPIPALGVKGAAISTATAQTVGGFLALRKLLKSDKIYVSFSWPIRIDVSIIKRILNVGIPAAIEQGSLRIGQLFYTIMIASLGTVSYAAHQVALHAESISFNPGFGFALAATTLVGQNLGAGQPERAESSGHAAGRLAILLMSFMGLIFFFFSEQIVYLFTPDEAVIKLAGICLKIVAVSQPALAVQMVYSGALRGAGDTRGILWITLSGFVVVRLGLTYILAIMLDYGLIGAWIAMGIDLYFRASLMLLRFKKGQWKLLKL